VHWKLSSQGQQALFRLALGSTNVVIQAVYSTPTHTDTFLDTVGFMTIKCGEYRKSF